MTKRVELVRLLSDGAFHSGTDLGKTLGITRAAICKSIRRLTQLGLEVHRVTGRGYKLDAPLILLDRSRILKYLGRDSAKFRDRLYLLDEVNSTNHFLAEDIAQRGIMSGATCLAEVQTGGRGRRGRHWVTTPYRNLMLSMAWRFPSGPGVVSGLSLAAGLAVLGALEEFGIAEAGLKWPNDILWDRRKLAGLLADVQGEATGPTDVILGVGINVDINRDDADRIDQPWVDLKNIVADDVDRNRLAAIIIRRLHRMFLEFAENGFMPFRKEWQARHLYQGRRVRLLQGGRDHVGIVEGIDDNGGLIIRRAKGRQVYHSGEISMRGAA